jgi:hypothetical protein
MTRRSSTNKFNNKLMESHRVVQNYKLKKDKFENEIEDLEKRRNTLTSQQYNYFQKKIKEKYEEFNHNSLIEFQQYTVLASRNDIARFKLQQKFIKQYS